MVKIILCYLVATFFIANLNGCKKRTEESFDPKSLKNGIDCVDMSKLEDDNLDDIRIIDLGIPKHEKIRHINELNSMPSFYLDAVRPHVQIILGPGGYASFPGQGHLKGVRPRGWTSGTWDDVAGGADPFMVNGILNVRLGPSDLLNGARSMVIHEVSHGIDDSFGITKWSQSTKSLFAELKNSPDPGDYNYSYRFVDISEFFAMAIEDYYCNATTRARLLRVYPTVHRWVEEKLPEILQVAITYHDNLNLTNDEIPSDGAEPLGLVNNENRAKTGVDQVSHSNGDIARKLFENKNWLYSADVLLREMSANEASNQLKILP